MKLSTYLFNTWGDEQRYVTTRCYCPCPRLKSHLLFISSMVLIAFLLNVDFWKGYKEGSGVWWWLWQGERCNSSLTPTAILVIDLRYNCVRMGKPIKKKFLKFHNRSEKPDYFCGLYTFSKSTTNEQFES